MAQTMFFPSSTSPKGFASMSSPTPSLYLAAVEPKELTGTEGKSSASHHVTVYGDMHCKHTSD
eukprot:gene9521-1711_t